MEISPGEFIQNKTCEPGSVAGCTGNEDSKFISGSPIVEAGGIDACNFTSLVYGTPTELLNSPTAAGDSIGLSDEEESKGYVLTTDGGFPVPCKPAFPMTISEADLSNCETIKEADGISAENNGNAEEKGPKHDDEDITGHKLTPLLGPKHDDEDTTGHELTPLLNGNKEENSKCLGSTEEKVSDVENGQGNSDTAARNSLSRERKRSKYLCYPFINLGKESNVLPLIQSEFEDCKSPGRNPTQDDDTFSLVKCGKRKRESRKSLTKSVKLEAITASSAELLTQLHVVAFDHLNFYFSSAFDPAELLFKRFRASVFRELPVSEVIGVLDEDDPDSHALSENQNTEPATNEKKPPSGLYDVNVDFSPDSQLPADSNTKPKRKRRTKKEMAMSASVSPNQTDGTPGKKKRIRKKGTKPEISYINGNNVKPISLEVCLQYAGPYPVAAETATQEKSSAEVTIDQMKQSLELMTTMLDKSASTISAETRASLEKEIRNLLQKVNPMANTSST